MTLVTLMRPLDFIEKDWLRKKSPRFSVGDTVEVHVKIIEGDRERVQIFTGIVIARRHEGLSETFTVRRIVQGEGVERIFPLHSPRVVDVAVKKKGKVRRAKLHFLRGRTGRATRVEERIGGAEKEEAPEKPAPETPPAEAPKAEKPSSTPASAK
jgi:large subunit ribosomal protein L19